MEGRKEGRNQINGSQVWTLITISLDRSTAWRVPCLTRMQTTKTETDYPWYEDSQKKERKKNRLICMLAETPFPS